MKPWRSWMLKCAVAGLCVLAQAGELLAEELPARPGQTCAVAAAASWSDVEEWIWERACIGATIDLGDRDDRDLDPSSAQGWDEKRRVSPQFVKTVLLGEPYRSVLPRHGLRIKGAWFAEELNLEEEHLDRKLALERCRFTEAVKLSALHSSSAISFRHSVFLQRVRLKHAVIKQWFDLRDTRFNYVKFDLPAERKETPALDMNGIHVGTILDMSDGEFADVDLAGAKIDGQLKLYRAKVPGRLNVGLASVGSSLYMRGATLHVVDLGGINVGGELVMAGASISQALDIRLSTIGINLLLDDGMLFADQVATVVLAGAKIGSDLYLQGSQSLPSIDLSAAKIEGELRLANETGAATWRDEAELILRNATVGTIRDAPWAWPQKLELDGFRYGSLRVDERPADWFVCWIERDGQYTPQPYLELASVLRRMAYRGMANDIAYAGRERARAFALEQGDYSTWLGQAALKYTIGYGIGHRYFWSLYWALGLVLLGAGLLRWSGQNQVDTHDGRPPMKIGLVYSLDMLLPIIRLRQRHYDVDLQGVVRHYFYVHQIMGYVLGSFLLAGLAGLTK